MAEMMQGVSPLTRSSRACRKTVSTVDPEFIVAPFPARLVPRLRLWPAMQTLRGIIAESTEAFDRPVSGRLRDWTVVSALDGDEATVAQLDRSGIRRDHVSEIGQFGDCRRKGRIGSRVCSRVAIVMRLAARLLP